MVFTANLFPFCHPSGVNKIGNTNTGASTQFEKEDEFELGMAKQIQGLEEGNEKNDAEEDEEEKEKKDDDDDQEDDENNNAGAKLDFATSSDGPVDYGFYKTFWSLQEFFRDPKTVSINKDKFDQFFDYLEHVVKALEGFTFSDKEKNIDNNNGNNINNH